MVFSLYVFRVSSFVSGGIGTLSCVFRGGTELKVWSAAFVISDSCFVFCALCFVLCALCFVFCDLCFVFCL